MIRSGLSCAHFPHPHCFRHETLENAVNTQGIVAIARLDGLAIHPPHRSPRIETRRIDALYRYYTLRTELVEGKKSPASDSFSPAPLLIQSGVKVGGLPQSNPTGGEAIAP